MCKMTRVSRSFLHFFKILNFWIIRGGKKAKNSPKRQKILSVALEISGTIHDMVVICGIQL